METLGVKGSLLDGTVWCIALIPCAFSVDIADQGEAIAPQHRARRCAPSFTTKAANGGTGSGLAMTATLVHEYGGRLTLQSAPGQGTCVCVTLPVANPILSAAAARRAESR